MSPRNDQRPPVTGAAVEMVERAAPTVTAEVVIDLQGATHEEAMRRCWGVVGCPAGSTVRLRVARGVEIVRAIVARQLRDWNPHVHVLVEAPDAETAHRWVAVLRGDT
ncbi:MAG TPA: hypothetical protein VFH38_09370 [Jatrophihabitans sp.]|nr:hypothetical protein [Jatrophihabitans sp.]